MDYFPITKIPNKRTNHAYYALIDLEEITIGYINLIERFPKRLSQRNEYIIVAYYFDANYIRVLLIKTEEELQ